MRHMKMIAQAGSLSAMVMGFIAFQPAEAQIYGVQPVTPVYGQGNIYTNPQQIIPYSNNSAYSNNEMNVVQSPGYPESGFGQTSNGLGQPTGGYENQNMTSPTTTRANSGGAPAAALPPVAGSKTAATEKTTKATPAKTAGKSVVGTVGPKIQIGDRLTGTPHALNGVTLAFGAGVVRIGSVVTPGLDTVCRSGATAWRCGEDSRAVLQTLVDVRPVTCIVTSVGTPAVAQCYSGNDDLAAMLVERGAVFDELHQFSIELAAAKANHLGIWGR